jgi:hypothetical protein
VTNVLREVCKTDPRLLNAIKLGFDDAASQVEDLAIRFGKAASPEQSVKAIRIVTQKHYRIGDKNDYCLLDGGRVIGRIFLHPQAPEGRPWFWTIKASEIPPSITRLFTNTRTSDSGFKS